MWNTHWTFPLSFFFFYTNNAQRRESLCGYCFQNSKIVSIEIFFRCLQKENVLSLFLSINKGNDFWLSCYYRNLYFQQERNGIAFITLIVWQFSHCIKNWHGRLKKGLICNENSLSHCKCIWYCPTFKNDVKLSAALSHKVLWHWVI